MKKGTIYTNEFKEAIIELVLKSDKSIAQLAIELGLSERTLYKWTYFERVSRNIGFMNLAQEKRLKEELIKTRHELKQAKREINILTKIVTKILPKEELLKL